MGIGVGCSCFCGSQTLAEYDPDTGTRVWKWGPKRTISAIGRVTYYFTIDEEQQCLIALNTPNSTTEKGDVALFDGLHTPSKRWESKNSHVMNVGSGVSGPLRFGYFPLMTPSGESVWASGSTNPTGTVRFDAENGEVVVIATPGPFSNVATLFSLSDESVNAFNGFAQRAVHILEDGTSGDTLLSPVSAGALIGRPQKIGDKYWIGKRVVTVLGGGGFGPIITNTKHYWISINEDFTIASETLIGEVQPAFAGNPAISTGFVRTQLCYGKTGVLCLRTDLAGGALQLEWVTGLTAAWTKAAPSSPDGVLNFNGQLETNDYLYFLLGGSGTGANLRFEKWSKASGAVIWSQDYGSGSGDFPGVVVAYGANSTDEVLAIVKSGALERDEDGFLRMPWYVTRLDSGSGLALWETRWSYSQLTDGLLGRARPYYCAVTEAGKIFVSGELTLSAAREAN